MFLTVENSNTTTLPGLQPPRPVAFKPYSYSGVEEGFESVDEGMKSPEARMLASFLRRRGDLGFCILEYPLDIFLDTGVCRRHRSFLTMSQLLSRIDAVCFEGVEELSRGFGGRIVRSNIVGDVVCDALERSKAVNVIEAKRELNRQILGDILFDI
jgi:hypothetical protein